MDQPMQAWGDLCRGAIDWLNRDPVYTKTEDIIADELEWIPPLAISSIIPNAHSIEVELVTKQTDLKALNQLMVAQGVVGIVLMGPSIGRHSQPDMIVLVTKDRYYAIPPSEPNRGVEFLRRKIHDKRIRYWTTNSIQESDCLLANYGIDLATCETLDTAEGLHIHMINSIRRMPGIMKIMYGDTVRCQALKMSRNSHLRVEKFEDLVKLWLNLDISLILVDPNKLCSLKSRPLNLTAINLIKKRCILAGHLIKILDKFSKLEIRVMSRYATDRLLHWQSNPMLNRYLMDITKKHQEAGVADLGFFTHMISGTSVWE